MSAVTIIKNIFEFVRILNHAAHDTVTKWDDQSVENALNWAEYCQELFIYIKGQECEQDVNSHLGQMTVYLDPVSCLTLSVDSLGDAKVLLVETLLSNPRFPVTSQKKLTSILQGNPDGMRILEKVQQKLVRSEKCWQVCTDLVGVLSERTDAGLLPGLRVEFQAKVLMQSLVAAAQSVKKIERFEKYCSAVYDKLAKTQEGWNIMVLLFAVEARDLPSDGVLDRNRTLNIFLSKIKQRAEEDICACLLWDVHVGALVKASCASEEFFITYLHALLCWGDSFFPQIDNRGLILWRSESGQISQAISLHFQSLLESASLVPQERKTRVLGEMTDRVKGTGFTVWPEIVQYLLKVLK